MTGDQILELLLLSSTEDDSGLWEMRWELNTQEQEVPVEQRNEHALWAVRELLRPDWACLYWTLEPDRDLHPIPAEEIERVLADPASWEPVAFGEWAVRISATPAGAKHRREDRTDIWHPPDQ